MKKYNVKFSLVNLFFQTQKEVQRLQTMWAGIAAIIITSTYINSSEKYTLIAALSCAVIDKLIGCLWLEERM
jgi:hypothetical protein